MSCVHSAWQVLIYTNVCFLTPSDSLESTTRDDWVNTELEKVLLQRKRETGRPLCPPAHARRLAELRQCLLGANHRLPERGRRMPRACRVLGAVASTLYLLSSYMVPVTPVPGIVGTQ